MKSLKKQTAHLLIVCVALSLLPMNLLAGQPNTRDLDAAIKTGDFGAYFTNISAWLNKKAPANISTAAMKTTLKDPVFAKALAQRQFITRVGADNLGAFAKADESNKKFLAWILQSTEAMENCLDGATPVGLKQRAAHNYRISVGSLNIWKRIFDADPESKKGIYLTLAIAIGQSPPGTGNQGVGQAKERGDALERYKDYKAAHKKGELVPSFDNLSVWEYRQVTSSNASNADLVWAREMLRTWRPDLTMNDRPVFSTSEVWRRVSPVRFDNSFKNVLAGGGKCGPRSSWAVFICQALGLPAFGVRQPGHACAAYKTSHPELQPQPGFAWKVVYGRGWQVSKLLNMSGTDFIKAATIRTHAKIFMQVERLRWLASALTSKERAAAIMKVAKEAGDEIPSVGGMPQNWKPDAKAMTVKKKPIATPVEEPFKIRPGVIHIEAETFAKSSGISVYPCYKGGKQVNFQKNIKSSWIDYAVDAPKTGTYGLTMRIAAPNYKQVLNISTGKNELATIKIPNTTGLWTTTLEVDVRLNKGVQTLRVAAPYQRGVALRWFELKSK